MSNRLCVTLLAAIAIVAVPARLLAQTVSPVETRAIAKEAYIYAFAMLESYQTWYSQAVDKNAMRRRRLQCVPPLLEPFTPDNHDVVTPNNDNALLMGLARSARGADGGERAGCP